MELVILGSGCAFPERNEQAAVRNPAGYAVLLDKGALLFDFGFGSLRQLARAGVDPSTVTDAFFTHRHPDHVGDLAALLFLLRYDVKPRRGRLRLWGPRGFRAFVDRLLAAYQPWLKPRGYKLEVAELSPRKAASARGWKVTAQAVPHPTPALAYRLAYRGKSLVYSGDTGYSPTLADFAAKASLFLLECTLAERETAVDHLNPPLALAILGASKCGRGVLTHLSAKSERELRALVPAGGRLLLAHDLMRVAI